MCDWCQTNSIFALLPWHFFLSVPVCHRRFVFVCGFLYDEVVPYLPHTQFLIGFEFNCCLLYTFTSPFQCIYL